jgi:hypothetical protein
MDRAGLIPRAGALAQDAAAVIGRAFSCFDHLEQTEVLGSVGQSIAASGPPVGCHPTRLDEGSDHLGQIRDRRLNPVGQDCPGESDPVGFGQGSEHGESQVGAALESKIHDYLSTQLRISPG